MLIKYGCGSVQVKMTIQTPLCLSCKYRCKNQLNTDQKLDALLKSKSYRIPQEFVNNIKMVPSLSQMKPKSPDLFP